MLQEVKKSEISLDEVEHGILSPRFRDPRIHFAVNCASKSCPPLQGEPFEASHLNDQLNLSLPSKEFVTI